MTSILNEFKISAKIPKNIKTTIKSFYVFEVYINNKNIIFVTNEDKVYGLGTNCYGKLGFGHRREVEECTEIKDLSNHNIKDFYSGYSHVLGRNDKDELFVWGRNEYGQLGRGFFNKRDEYLTPQKVEIVLDDKIEDICCGKEHTLVLLSNGVLYGWGRNSDRQLGLNSEDIIDIPIKLKLNEKNDLKFRYIYCHNWSSFAITTNGLLFSWGYNYNGLLGQGIAERECIPRRIDLFNVQKIFSNDENSYFLTNEGSIYFCGKYEEKSKLLIQNKPKRVKDLKQNIYDFPRNFENFNEVFYCDSENSFYNINGIQIELIDEKCDSIYELYAKIYEITPQTVHISNDGTIERQYTHKCFELLSVMGSGGFGTVGKYLNTTDKQLYAIKKINISIPENIYENILKEVQTMSKLKNDFIVQYNDSWIEDNRLFIQMEFCFHNLRYILTIKPMIFERKENQTMNSIEFFISCEIFRQITEALNYLHSIRPEPLVHRDLKPENILIGKSGEKSICKLADFGLCKCIEYQSDYYSPVGTYKYIAPEIAGAAKYDSKADIWSLGMIGLEIFNLENETGEQPGSSRETAIYDEIISTRLLLARRHQRISCEELLPHLDRFRISRNSIELDIESYQDKFSDMNLQYFIDILNE